MLLYSRGALILVLAFVGAACRGRAMDRSRLDAKGAAAPGPAGTTLRFDPNRGQFDPRVRYRARGHGYSLCATQEGMTVGLRRSGGEAAVVGLRIAGARSVEPVGVSKLDGVTNYFLGADPARWRTGLEGYARVRYPGVLP